MHTPKARTPVSLHAGLSVSDALAAILRHNFHDLRSWEPAARSWNDTEGVHQLRVSSRRLRAALAAFRTAVPKPVSGPWRAELGWVARELGRARDLDVLIAEGLAAVRDQLPLAGGRQLQALAERQRAAAYEEVRAMLDGERYARLGQHFPEWFESAAWRQAELTRARRRRLELPIGNYARKQLKRQERRVLDTGAALDRNDPRQLHQLRIECKKLRYLAEFFAPLIPGLDDFIGQLKRLQDLLGVLNDANVTGELLAELLAGESDPDPIRYAGGLIGWRARQASELLAGFDTRWRTFAEIQPPW